MTYKIPAVVTTMDNLPSNKEQLAVLRADPLVTHIIYVNQDSKDGTREWLDEQPGVVAVHRANDGAGPGRNAGIDKAAELCGGAFDFILLCDGGMRPLHGGTQRMLDYLAVHPEVDGVATDWHTLETDYNKAWRRWADPITTGAYHNRVLSLTHYGLFRWKCFDGFRFAEHGPFGMAGWGADDDELAHRWDDAGIVIHAVQHIKAYRRASGSWRRLWLESKEQYDDKRGIWPNQYGSTYESRLVWLQQEQPHHGKGEQWGEPWLTVVVKVGGVEDTARLIKHAHERLRLRRQKEPWQRFYQPYSIVAWGGSSEWLEWAEPRRLRQHHGDTIIVDSRIVRKDEANKDAWAGDFRVWTGDDWREAVRPNAFYYGMVKDMSQLDALLARYDEAHPPEPVQKPSGRGELTYG